MLKKKILMSKNLQVSEIYFRDRTEANGAFLSLPCTYLSNLQIVSIPEVNSHEEKAGIQAQWAGDHGRPG